MKVLLIDDEVELTDSLKKVLIKENFSCEAINDSTLSLDYIKNGEYDIVILDVMMPKINGYEVLKEIRRRNIKVPVIFLTAKSDLDDKLVGLDLGADDYLTKPFSSKELVARIKAIVRRNGNFVTNTLEFHDLKLDLSTYKLSCGKKEVLLINKEFQLMELFMMNPNVCYSTEDLLNKIWGYDSFSDITTVWSFLSSLRKKIATLTNNIKIKSNRGLGYILIYEV